MRKSSERLKEKVQESYNNIIALESEIKSSASEVKVLMIFLIISELFITITASTVTDLQLFLTNNLYAIPFLGFSINVVNFFVFAPIILLLIHYNLLSTLVFHSKHLAKYIDLKIVYNNHAKKNNELNIINDSVFSDVINRLYDRGDDNDRKLIHINCAILFCIFPLYTQLFLLIKFLKYQDALISLGHLVIITISCFISIFYWQKISSSNNLKYKSNNLGAIKILSSVYYIESKKYKRIPLRIRRILKLFNIDIVKSSISKISVMFLFPLAVKCVCFYSMFILIISVNLNYHIENNEQLFQPHDQILTYFQSYEQWVYFVIITSLIITLSVKTHILIFNSIFLSVIIRVALDYYEQWDLNSSVFIELHFFYLFVFLLFKLGKYKRTTRRNKIKSQLNFWRYIEISSTFTVLLSSFVIFSLLCILLAFGKVSYSTLTFINNIYPKIDASQKQLFNMSKSSSLFEFAPEKYNDYQKHAKIIRDCSGIDRNLCQIIEPITIKNRNLLFSNLSSSKAYRLNVINNDMRYSNFQDSHLQGSKITSSNLEGSIFRFSNLQGSDIEDSIFDNTTIKEVNLSYSNITNSSFVNFKICDTSLVLSYIEGNDFRCKPKGNLNKDDCSCALYNFELMGTEFRDNKNIDIDIKYLDSTQPTIITFIDNKTTDVNKMIQWRSGVNKDWLPVISINNKEASNNAGNLLSINNPEKKHKTYIDEMIDKYINKVLEMNHGELLVFHSFFYIQIKYLVKLKIDTEQKNSTTMEENELIMPYFDKLICHLKNKHKKTESDIKNEFENNSKLNVTDKKLILQRWDNLECS